MLTLVFIFAIKVFLTEGRFPICGKVKDGEYDSKLYLLSRHNEAKQILNEESAELIGCNNKSYISLTSFDVGGHGKYTIGDPIPSLKPANCDPDLAIKLEMDKSLSITGNLIENLTYFGEYVNAAIVPYKGRLLLAVPLEQGASKNCNEFAPLNDQIWFRWWNDSKYPFYDSNPYLGIDTKLGPLNYAKSDATAVIVGQDPRMVYEPSKRRLYMLFTNPFTKPVAMGMVVFELNETIHELRIVYHFKHISSVLAPKQKNKNWSPFIYKDELFLMDSINPMIVLKPLLVPYGGTTTEVVSSSPFIPGIWDFYGHALRGGTNAVFLPQHNVYLAFFHTQSHLSGSGMTTYLMGAYTFSAHPPFRLLAVSPLPFVHKEFYLGPWFWNHLRKLDYVVFPMNLYLEDDNHTAVMIMGSADHFSWFVKFDIKRLLHTLEPVEDNGTSHVHHHSHQSDNKQD